MSKITKVIVIVVCIILFGCMFYINVQKNNMAKLSLKLETLKVDLAKTESANIVLGLAIENPATEKKAKITIREVPFIPEAFIENLNALRLEIDKLEGENAGLSIIYDIVMANLPDDVRREIIYEIGEKSEPKVPVIKRDEPAPAVDVDFRRITTIVGYPGYFSIGYAVNKKYDISILVDTDKRVLVGKRW